MSNGVRSATASAPPGFGIQKKGGTISPSSPKKDLELSSRNSAGVGTEAATLQKSQEDTSASGGGGTSGKPSTDKKRRSIRGVGDRAKSLFSSLRKKKSRTVVCIDSDLAVLDSLTKILEELNFFPVCFASSVEGKEYLMEQLHGQGVALVIASMMMTGISGMQLMQEVRGMREEVGEVPFLLTSSFNKGNTKVQEFQIKTADGTMADVMLKPLVSGVVMRKVRDLTERLADEGEDRKTAPSPGTGVLGGTGKKVTSPANERKPLTPGDKSASGGTPAAGGGGTNGPRSPPLERQSDREPSSPNSNAARRELASSDARVVLDSSRSTSSSGNDKLLSSAGSPATQHSTPPSDSPTRVRSKTASKAPAVKPRKGSDPGEAPALPRSVSHEGAFLDTLFTLSSTQGVTTSGAGPDWGELEDDVPPPELKAAGRRKTIHGISALKKKNNF